MSLPQLRNAPPRWPHLLPQLGIVPDAVLDRVLRRRPPSCLPVLEPAQLLNLFLSFGWISCYQKMMGESSLSQAAAYQKFIQRKKKEERERELMRQLRTPGGASSNQTPAVLSPPLDAEAELDEFMSADNYLRI